MSTRIPLASHQLTLLGDCVPALTHCTYQMVRGPCHGGVSVAVANREGASTHQGTWRPPCPCLTALRGAPDPAKTPSWYGATRSAARIALACLVLA